MINDIISDARGRMGGAVDSFKKEVSTVRTGRASVSMLDDVRVEMYGTMMPLNQLATVSTPDARLIVVQPWDRSSIEPIEKAINAANLGLSPSNDGKVIRLPVPPLSEERRRDLVKQVKKRNEEAKIEIRGVRRDAKEMIEELEKESEIAKDDAHRALEELQGVTDSFAAKVDDLTATKEKEIMEF